MAQGYNVDDILEEIRRKKSREAQQETPRRTYQQDNTSYQDESRYGGQPAPRRASDPQQSGRPRTTGRQSQMPAGAGYSGNDIPPLGSRRSSRPSAFPYRNGTDREMGMPGGQRGNPLNPPNAVRGPQGYRTEGGGARADSPYTERSQRSEYPQRESYRRQEQNYGRERPRADGFNFRDTDPEAQPSLPESDYRSPKRTGRPDGFSFQATGRIEPEAPERFDFDQQTETDSDFQAGQGFRLESDLTEEPENDGFGASWDTPVEEVPTLEEDPYGVEPQDGFAFQLPDDDAPAFDDGTRMDIPVQPRESGGFDSGFTQEIETSSYTQRRQERRRDPLAASPWKQSYAEQELLEAEQPEDGFNSPEDIPFVEKDLKSIGIGLNVRLVLTVILGVLSTYFAFSLKVLPFAEKLGLKEGYMLPLPTVMFPEENMRLFLIVNLVIVVLAAIVCSNIVGRGITSFCTLRADADSPAALAILAVLIQGIVLMVFPDAIYASDYISLYFPVAVIVLIFNLVGKKMMMARIRRNFHVLTSEKDKYAFLQIQNREFSREFSRGLGPDVDRVAYSARADFITGFLDKSYSTDYSDSFNRLVTPIVFVGSIVVGVVTFVMAKDLPVAVSAFSAVLCICAPFSSVVVPNLMLSRMSKKLTKRGNMLAGYETAEDYTGPSAVVISDRDLFPGDTVMLHGMKVFAEKRIDEAILDAASVILSCNGIMSGVFLNMIGGNKRMLKKVDSLLYEDGMGISAWVDGKRVLIGNHELMRNHDIDCPSRDFESRYARDGRRVLYIANSGELSAMFVVSYNAEPDIAKALCDLERRGVSAVVYAADPNITSDLISRSFGVKKASVRILPAKLHPEYAYLIKPKEKVCTGAVHAGSLANILTLYQAARAVKRSVMNGTITQLVGTIVGYGLMVFIAFTGSLSMATFSMLILFNLAWLILTSILSSAVKK